MKAYLKNARISPKKMNLVAGPVRGKTVVDALNQLKFTPKKAAHILYKTINSAAKNAEANLQQERANLIIKSIIVNKGVTYKRGLAVSRGRYHRLLKRNTNLTVTLDIQEPEKPKAETKPKAENKKKEEEKEKKTPTKTEK